MANILDGYSGQFFSDQNVTAKDLNMIGYSSNKAFRDYLKALTTNPGVVSSDLTVDTSLKVTTIDGTLFDIFAGTAVDSAGRIINIPVSVTASGSIGDDPKYHPAFPNRTNLSSEVTSAGTYYVNLVYTPMYGSAQYDDSGNSFNTRVYDSYTISVDAARTLVGITLAAIMVDASGSIKQDGSAAQNGYRNSTTGIRYAIYDDRPTFQVTDGRIGSLETLTTLHTIDLAEELEKGAGFLYPQAGHAFSATIPRNVLIKRFSVLGQGSAGTITAYLYSGSTAVIEDMRLLANVQTSFGVWTSQTLNLTYTAGDTLRIEIADAGASITECTTSIVYCRR